jgi:catechol 2,3-dioxygenase-like lactoylglutathione lyase family enzyme
MMPVTQVTPILNVSDVPASRDWFARLGWSRGFAWNSGGMIAGGADANSAGPATFGSVRSGDCEIFLCRDGQGSRARPLPRHAGDNDTGGVWMSWWVSGPAEVDALHALALEVGFTVTRSPANEPWGVREFHLRHPDGHTFRVSAGVCDE